MVRAAGEQGSLKRTATGASAARGAASLSMGTFHRKENRAVPARKTGIARMEAHWRSLFLFRFLPLSFPPVMEEAEAWHGFPAVSISKCRVMKRCRAGCHCGVLLHGAEREREIFFLFPGVLWQQVPPGKPCSGWGGYWGACYSGALKLYTGLMRSTISAVSWMLSSTLSPSL